MNNYPECCQWHSALLRLVHIRRTSAKPTKQSRGWNDACSLLQYSHHGWAQRKYMKARAKNTLDWYGSIRGCHRQHLGKVARCDPWHRRLGSIASNYQSMSTGYTTPPAVVVQISKCKRCRNKGNTPKWIRRCKNHHTNWCRRSSKTHWERKFDAIASGCKLRPPPKKRGGGEPVADSWDAAIVQAKGRWNAKCKWQRMSEWDRWANTCAGNQAKRARKRKATGEGDSRKHSRFT